MVHVLIRLLIVDQRWPILLRTGLIQCGTMSEDGACGNGNVSAKSL